MTLEYKPADRRQDLLNPLLGPHAKAEDVAAASTVDAPTGEAQLARTCDRLRHDETALLSYLGYQVPDWQRRTARIVLIRTLGAARAHDLCDRAFGFGAVPLSVAAPPSGERELELRLGRAHVQGIKETLLHLLRDHALAASELPLGLLSVSPRVTGETALRELQGASDEATKIAVSQLQDRRGGRRSSPMTRFRASSGGHAWAQVAERRAGNILRRELGATKDLADPDQLVHVVQGYEGRITSLASGGPRISEPGDALEREAVAAADSPNTQRPGNVSPESLPGARAASPARRSITEIPGALSPGRSTAVGAVGAVGEKRATVHRTVHVNPVASSRLNKLALLGDGTPAHPGLSVHDLNAYVTRQADWFSEPSLTQADRDTVWRVLLQLHGAPHMGVALASLPAAAITGLSAGDSNKLNKYAACFDSAAQTIQVSTPAATLARARALGQAIIDLEAFVPTPVLRVVIPESGLVYLVDRAKIPEFRRFYQLFRPTLESPAEWPHIEVLLTETVAPYAALAAWVHDLHIFTRPTRQRLLRNVGDRSRSRPVMLILMSASDWNAAFLQASNLESAILNLTNLALVVQGATSIGNATAEVNRVADDYGQQTSHWDWNTWRMVRSPGRLGQVVMAGHGSDQSVEMASPGTGATAVDDNRHVRYDQTTVDSSDPTTNGTQLLIDTVLTRMDPADANVVFAGCLVGSHEVPAGTNVGNAATAQANLQAALRAHPNLADYVRQRMTARGVTGTVQAANGSTTFSSFNVDAGGRARLSNSGDPDISGTKLQYVRTGIEPEGAIRAAIECYADSAIGPARTTTEMRTRVAGLAANHGWWETVTRIGFELCLPPAPADVDVAKMLDVVHRIEPWFLGGWANMIDVQRMANNALPAEAPRVFSSMLTSSWAVQDHLAVGVREAWLQYDAAQGGPFMAALTASALNRVRFQPLLARGIVDPRLATLLPVGAPTKGQLILALTIAVGSGAGMPGPVRTFLRAAAGGRTTSTFPAALGVGPLIAPTGELSVLQSIELAPSSAPPPSSSGGGATVVDGNVDANHNNTNETYIAVSPHETSVIVPLLNIRRRPNTGSAVVDVVHAGAVLRVMGQTESGWSFVDHQGRTGFVTSRFLTP